MKIRKYVVVLFSVIVWAFLLLPQTTQRVSSQVPQDFETLKAIQARHQEAIVNLPGVLLIGITKEDEVLKFLIYVNPERGQPQLPTNIEGVPVTVLLGGDLVAWGSTGRRELRGFIPLAPAKLAINGNIGLAATQSVPNQEPFTPPVPMGVSTSNDLSCGAGTLGFKVQDRFALSIVGYVTVNHIATAGSDGCPDEAGPGTPQFQPGLADTNCLERGTLIGTLERFIPLPDLGSSDVDAAFVVSDNDLVSSVIFGIGAPGSTIREPDETLLRETVRKSGRTTGVTEGTVEAVNASIRFFDYGCGLVNLTNQILVSRVDSFAASGDSGAPVVTLANEPVGMVVGRNPSGTDVLVESIGAALDALSVDLFTAPAPICQLTPATATNPPGTNHTVTATVTQDGVPMPGVTVNFSVTSGPNTGQSGSRTTDDLGQARFTYTSNGVQGTDTIQASGSVSGDAFSCAATKTWAVTTVSCSLTPATDTNPVGTNHTVTATVTNGGNPVAGVAVSFVVTQGPNVRKNGRSITNANGQASFTYTGTGGVGTDQIRASGFVNQVPFNCTATKTWVSP
jgi:hypothetical protein